MSERSTSARRGATPRSRTGLVTLVIAFGLAVIALAALVMLLQSAPRRAGTNLIVDLGPVIHLIPGQVVCQPGEIVPADTGALRLDAATGGVPGGALTAAISSRGRMLSSGRLGAGWATGTVSIPLRGVRSTVTGASVCVGNLGSSEVDLGGSVAPGPTPGPGAQPPVARMRIEYVRPRSETWLQFAPVVAKHFSLAKSDVLRHWEIGAVLVLMLVAIATAARTLTHTRQAA